MFRIRTKYFIYPSMCLTIFFIVFKVLPDSKNKMKYILLRGKSWQMNMDNGQSIFLENQCPVNNCYITLIESIFPSISYFDAVVFDGKNLSPTSNFKPKTRSRRQKYIFYTLESPVSYPLHSQQYNGFFNWTMTPKLNSDLVNAYMVIKLNDGNREIIGPKENMHWLKKEDMRPIDENVRKKLQRKMYAVAWFVSNCKAESKRKEIALVLQKELKKHNLDLHIYSPCEWGSENMRCPIKYDSICLEILSSSYYFYLSFENSLSDDYVTEKLLNALQYDTVPIVYGGANYTRFMPDGAYLDVRKLGIKKLVQNIVAAVNNSEIYYDFFRWTNHYTYYHPTDLPETDPYCILCRSLNDDNLVKRISMYEEFTKWWNAKTCSDSVRNVDNETDIPDDYIKVHCNST